MTDGNQTQPQMSRFREAYERILPEIEALPLSELITINIDVPQAVATTLGAWPEIRALRDELVTEVPKFNLARFDKIETYAYALLHAQARYNAASTPQGLQELGDQAAKLRELLLADVVTLSKRGQLDGTRLKELRGALGYKNVAMDLLTLTEMMREKWSELAGKTAVQAKELDDAEALADRLISGVGLREQGPALVLEAADRRQRTFTLFINAYDQARRAISYLRWDHEDVDSIAPSLYSGRTKRRVEVSEAAPVAPTVPVAAAPTVPVAPSINGGSGAPQATVPGLPGGPAFTAS